MTVTMSIKFSFFSEDIELIPPDALMPVIADVAAMPAKDDVVFISPRSAWRVMLREFQQTEPDRLQVLLWLAPAPELLGLKALAPLRPVPPPEQH